MFIVASIRSAIMLPIAVRVMVEPLQTIDVDMTTVAVVFFDAVARMAVADLDVAAVADLDVAADIATGHRWLGYTHCDESSQDDDTATN